MKRYWLVRHGESLAQKGAEFSIDSSLSERGRLQAERLKSALGEIKFDIAYISPLKRARETYEYSGLSAEVVRFDSRLIEDMPPGSYEKILPYEELPRYGESDEHMAWNIDSLQRARMFYRDTLQNSDNRRILIISHSCFLDILFYSIFSENSVCEGNIYMGMNNCGISSFTVDQGKNNHLTLLFWNYYSHVKDLLGYEPMKDP